MIKKKAEVSQIFVFLTSIFIIGFVGYLVVGFIGTIDTDDIAEQLFYDDFNFVFNKIYKEYNSEIVQEFKLPNKLTFVCILDQRDAMDVSSIVFPNTMVESSSDLEFLANQGDNLIVFDEDGLLSSLSLENPFLLDNSEGVLCLEPVNSRIELYFENDRNDVFISSFN